MTDDATRLRDRLAALGLSQRALARALGKNERSVRDWASSVTPVPDLVWRWLDDAIAPPPAGSSPDEDRDDACVTALAPHLRNLAERARSAGWHEAEVYAALLTCAVETMRDRAGDRATRETLTQAVMQMAE